MDTHELAQWLEERLDRLDNKLDTMREHTARIDVTMARNTADVEHHIKRTDALTERVEQVATHVDGLQEWYAKAKGVVWVAGVVAALVAFAAALREWIP